MKNYKNYNEKIVQYTKIVLGLIALRGMLEIIKLLNDIKNLLSP